VELWERSEVLFPFFSFRSFPLPSFPLLVPPFAYPPLSSVIGWQSNHFNDFPEDQFTIDFALLCLGERYFITFLLVLIGLSFGERRSPQNIWGNGVPRRLHHCSSLKWPMVYHAWNQLPTTIRQMDCIVSFKRRLKTSLLWKRAVHIEHIERSPS